MPVVSSPTRSLPPSGAAGGVLGGTYPSPTMAAGAAATNVGTVAGDLSGTLPNPTVAKVNGIAVTGTPSTGYVPTATSASAATWQAAGGSQAVEAVTVTLTNAQVKALPTTTPQIIAAPGADKMVVPFHMTVTVTLIADYTNIDPSNGMVLTSAGGERALLGFSSTATRLSDFLAAGGSTVNLAAAKIVVDAGVPNPVTALDLADMENSAYVLVTDNSAAGDFTGGNAGNSMKITVLYTTIDV